MMKQYTHTDQYLHLLCQTIAKANRTFVPKKDDDSHTNLYFDSIGNRITGRWIKTKEDKLLFTLNLESLAMEVVNSAQEIIASFATIGNTMEEIEHNIEERLPKLGLHKSGFREKLHYDIPAYTFATEPVRAIPDDALNEWKHFRQLANEACALLLGYLQAQEEIRIWPHHFDTGIYTVVNAKLGLGFGLAMKDEMVGAPYFYMSGYALKGSINYDNLPEGTGWKWEIGAHWKGAVLPLTAITKNDLTKVTHFVSQASHAFLQAS